MFISCSVAFFHARSVDSKRLFLSTCLHRNSRDQKVINHDFTNKIFFFDLSIIMTFGMYLLHYCHKSKRCNSRPILSSGKAQWLVNFSMQMASQRAKLARFVPDALKQIEPFHFHCTCSFLERQQIRPHIEKTKNFTTSNNSDLFVVLKIHRLFFVSCPVQLGTGNYSSFENLITSFQRKMIHVSQTLLCGPKKIN